MGAAPSARLAPVQRQSGPRLGIDEQEVCSIPRRHLTPSPETHLVVADNPDHRLAANARHIQPESTELTSNLLNFPERLQHREPSREHGPACCQLWPRGILAALRICLLVASPAYPPFSSLVRQVGSFPLLGFRGQHTTTLFCPNYYTPSFARLSEMACMHSRRDAKEGE
ncbi:hypothetical protein CORC01_01837 [Colletotrichum orchidophilum]|uniref:Uncharacterized protein n=1 Tax=Colletotrichum orchidophilum TaxID=1209926 RepID=A0A1G4BN61_9PEZI|nr:uncharacterized protein CORC01_01837 [Colletotrichum orchidophilum]OHF02736.1 hypothetical protein CORC01_01837 [Colletotrichum orchidophilum]